MDFKVITAVTNETVTSSDKSLKIIGMTPNFSGIYEIRCTVTGKVYVGSAVRIAKRWCHHREALRQGKHHSAFLQNAWNKYGEDSFEFKVLVRCKVEELIPTEQAFIDQMMAADRRHGYNILPRAGSRLGSKLTNEAKAKVSAARAGKPLSDAHKSALSASLKGNQRRRGIPHSPEALKKLSEVSKRNYAKNAAHLIYAKTPAQRAEVGRRFRGRPLSDEHRAKISASRMGHVNTPEQLAKFAAARRVLSDEKLSRMREMRVQGCSQAVIAAELGCSKQTICNALRGTKGYGA